MLGCHHRQLRCTVAGGNRDGFWSAYSFAFKNRNVLNARELAQAQLRRGVVEHAGYVLRCVKTCTRDNKLQQPPLLVLPQLRCSRAQGLPGTVEPINTSEDRVAHLEGIDTVIKYDKYMYHRAARELRNIARNTILPTLLAPGWLAYPPVLQSPVAKSGSEYCWPLAKYLLAHCMLE